jgi:hypothetical protein
MMFPSVESHPPETKGKIHSIKQRERKLAATFSGARACDERPLPLILSRALVVIKAEAAAAHTMFHPFRKNKHDARAGGRRKINSGARARDNNVTKGVKYKKGACTKKPNVRVNGRSGEAK